MHRPTMHRCARALAASVALLTLLLLAVGRSGGAPAPVIPAPAGPAAGPPAALEHAIPSGLSAGVDHAASAVLLPARVPGPLAHGGAAGTGLLLASLTLLAVALLGWRHGGTTPALLRSPVPPADAAVDRHWRDGQRPATRRGPPHQPQR